MVTKHVRSVIRRPRALQVREPAASWVDADTAAVDSQPIPAGEFKAQCLALMDDVQERGTEYVITKRGVPVAKLVPVRAERRRLLGSMQGTVKAVGDIVSPLDEAWEAMAPARDRQSRK